jgi:hypothetical protein
MPRFTPVRTFLVPPHTDERFDEIAWAVDDGTPAGRAAGRWFNAQAVRLAVDALDGEQTWRTDTQSAGKALWAVQAFTNADTAAMRRWATAFARLLHTQGVVAVAPRGARASRGRRSAAAHKVYATATEAYADPWAPAPQPLRLVRTRDALGDLIYAVEVRPAGRDWTGQGFDHYAAAAATFRRARSSNYYLATSAGAERRGRRSVLGVLGTAGTAVVAAIPAGAGFGYGSEVGRKFGAKHAQALEGVVTRGYNKVLGRRASGHRCDCGGPCCGGAAVPATPEPLGQAARKVAARGRYPKLPAAAFALPAKRKYPMDTRLRGAAARARAVQQWHAGRLTRRELVEVYRRTAAAWGFTDPPPRSLP